jgi:hypothetical protein
MSVQYLETTKLWYNKYLYKVVVRNQDAYRMGFAGRYSGLRLKLNEEIEHLLEMIKENDCRTRGEGSHVSVFTNNRKMVTEIQNTFFDTVEEIWEPDPSLIHVLKQPNTILVKEPASHPIRVTLNDKRIDSDFTQWIDANPDKVTVGDTAYRAIKRGWMVGGLYFYLRDDKILSLVNLMIWDNIRRVDRLVCES